MTHPYRVACSVEALPPIQVGDTVRVTNPTNFFGDDEWLGKVGKVDALGFVHEDLRTVLFPNGRRATFWVEELTVELPGEGDHG